MKDLIVVTGGTGYIGSHTTVELMEAGYEVLIIDNLANSQIEVLDGIEKITGKKPLFEKYGKETGSDGGRERRIGPIVENPAKDGLFVSGIGHNLRRFRAVRVRVDREHPVNRPA